MTGSDLAEPPQAIEAEQAVLGAMLLSGQAVTEARRILTTSDFYRPAHEIVFGACCDLADTGIKVDPVTVLTELGKRNTVTKVGGATYLHTLISGVPTAANAAHYAREVRATSRRRQLVVVGERIAQIGRETVDIEDALTNAAAESLALNVLVDETDDAPITGLSTYRDFLAQPERAEDWVVPGLIERQDVFMILATPGGGKSWLSRQFVLCLAAGVHPFDPTRRIAPQRTLLVDLENPPSMVRRQSRPLAAAVAKLAQPRLGEEQLTATATPAGPLAHIYEQPGGINIRKRQDAQLLERVIAETRPSFVALGSLYNAFERGRDDWDTAAEEAKAVFNRLRSRYGCAFLIEHHMPKGSDSKSPFGSSVWERWPGFGRVIERKSDTVYQLAKTFRGDRDQRQIPAGLQRGGELPWIGISSQADVDRLAANENAWPRPGGN